MAKKGARIISTLVCTVCKSQNYTTEKNRKTTVKELVLNKFCSKCGKVIEHKEKKK